MELDFCNHVLGHLKFGVEKVLDFEASLISYAKNEHAEFYAQINASGDYNKEVEGQFKSLLESFVATQTW